MHYAIFSAGGPHLRFFSWHTHSMRMSSLGCKALCIVIIFFIPWFIYWISFLLSFQEWHRVSYKRGSPSVYLFDEIPFTEFGFDKPSHSSEILFFKKKKFISSPLVWLCKFSIFSSSSKFSFPSVLSWFGCSIPFVICLFRFSLFSWHIFLCQIPFLYSEPISFIVCMSLQFFFFFGKQLDVVHFHLVVNLLFCDLVYFSSFVHFLSMWLSDIISITNTNDKNTFPWKICLWIFALDKDFPLAINSTFQFFMVFVMNLMTLSDI